MLGLGKRDWGEKSDTRSKSPERAKLELVAELWEISSGNVALVGMEIVSWVTLGISHKLTDL